MRCQSKLIFPHLDIPLTQHHLLKGPFLLIAPLDYWSQESRVCLCMGSPSGLYFILLVCLTILVPISHYLNYCISHFFWKLFLLTMPISLPLTQPTPIGLCFHCCASDALVQVARVVGVNLSSFFFLFSVLSFLNLWAIFSLPVGNTIFPDAILTFLTSCFSGCFL